jgi:long-chain acyl-CoA synthetase
VVALCLVHDGRRIGFLADPGELPAELAAFRPTILLAVPRVFEKVAAAAREQAEAEGHRRLFAAAEATAVAYSRAGHRAGPLLWLRHAVFGRLVYARLRAALGGQVAWAVSGGAPLNQELGHFLRGAGITVIEGWGLTETTGPVTMNPPAVQKIGSVGLPLPGCAVQIAPDGEIEVTGPIVFQGYWHDPQATTQVFDGLWLRTGDLGRLDDDGFLYVTGRKKDLIITAGGKNVAPEVLEDRLREHWLIEEGVVVGDQRPYIAALVTLDREAFARWKRRQGKPASATIGDLSQDPDLLAAVGEAVDRANTAVSHAEAIKRFRILPGCFAVGAELTRPRRSAATTCWPRSPPTSRPSTRDPLHRTLVRLTRDLPRRRIFVGLNGSAGGPLPIRWGDGMAKAPGERERRIVVGLAKYRMIAGRAATVAG